MSNLFINIINHSIEYEKLLLIKNEQKRDELKIKIQMHREVFTPLQIWSVQSDNINIPYPKGVKIEELMERNQMTASYFI